jgi:hypothetical protein
MKFVSARELRNRPGEVWKMLREEDLVLTSSGKPRGLLLNLEGEDFVEMVDTITRLRAEAAASKMRQQAVESGLDEMTMDEIDDEIRAVRSERASS